MEEKILEWEAGSQLRGTASTGSEGSSSLEDNSAVNDELQRLKDQLNNRKEV